MQNKLMKIVAVNKSDSASLIGQDTFNVNFKWLELIILDVIMEANKAPQKENPQTAFSCILWISL